MNIIVLLYTETSARLCNVNATDAGAVNRTKAMLLTVNMTVVEDILLPAELVFWRQAARLCMKEMMITLQGKIMAKGATDDKLRSIKFQIRQ